MKTFSDLIRYNIRDGRVLSMKYLKYLRKMRAIVSSDEVDFTGPKLANRKVTELLNAKCKKRRVDALVFRLKVLRSDKGTHILKRLSASIITLDYVALGNIDSPSHLKCASLRKANKMLGSEFSVNVRVFLIFPDGEKIEV